MNVLGQYLNTISTIPILDRKEEKKQIILAQKGDQEAKNKIILANLKFVAKVARGYNGCGLSYEDIIAEGNIGIMNAIKTYDTEKGFRFISYAVFWIKQGIIKAIAEQSKVVRLPLNVNNQLSSIKKKLDQLSNFGKTKELKIIAEKVGLKEKSANHILGYLNAHVSLDKSVEVKDNKKVVVGDIITSAPEYTPDYIVENNFMKQALKRSINKVLNTQEIEVIKMRFSLDNEKVKTLSEIGKKKKLSKERVRQIEEKALLKLKNSPEIKDLRFYL